MPRAYSPRVGTPGHCSYPSSSKSSGGGGSRGTGGGGGGQAEFACGGCGRAVDQEKNDGVCKHCNPQYRCLPPTKSQLYKRNAELEKQVKIQLIAKRSPSGTWMMSIRYGGDEADLDWLVRHRDTWTKEELEKCGFTIGEKA